MGALRVAVGVSINQSLCQIVQVVQCVFTHRLLSKDLPIVEKADGVCVLRTPKF